MQASVREQAGLEEVVVYGTVTETRQTFAAASGVIRFRPERFLKGRLPESGAWQTDARSGSRGSILVAQQFHGRPS